jgi:hypothetical protein
LDQSGTLAIRRQFAYARAVFKIAIEEKPSVRSITRGRSRAVKHHLEGIGGSAPSLPSATSRAVVQSKPEKPAGRPRGTIANSLFDGTVQ